MGKSTETTGKSFLKNLIKKESTQLKKEPFLTGIKELTGVRRKIFQVVGEWEEALPMSPEEMDELCGQVREILYPQLTIKPEDAKRVKYFKKIFREEVKIIRSSIRKAIIEKQTEKGLWRGIRSGSGELFKGQKIPNDIEVAEIPLYSRLAVAIAKEFTDRDIDFFALIQAGSSVLLEAAKNLDPSKKINSFTIKWWVYQAILKAIYDQNQRACIPKKVSIFLPKARDLCRSNQEEGEKLARILCERGNVSEEIACEAAYLLLDEISGSDEDSEKDDDVEDNKVISSSSDVSGLVSVDKKIIRRSPSTHRGKEKHQFVIVPFAPNFQPILLKPRSNSQDSYQEIQAELALQESEAEVLQNKPKASQKSKPKSFPVEKRAAPPKRKKIINKLYLNEEIAETLFYKIFGKLLDRLGLDSENVDSFETDGAIHPELYLMIERMGEQRKVYVQEFLISLLGSYMKKGFYQKRLSDFYCHVALGIAREWWKSEQKPDLDFVESLLKEKKPDLSNQLKGGKNLTQQKRALGRKKRLPRLKITRKVIEEYFYQVWGGYREESETDSETDELIIIPHVNSLYLPVKDSQDKQSRVNFHTFMLNLARIYVDAGYALPRKVLFEIGLFFAERWYKNNEKPDLASAKLILEKEKPEWFDWLREDEEKDKKDDKVTPKPSPEQPGDLDKKEDVSSLPMLVLKSEEEIEEYFYQLLGAYIEKFKIDLNAYPLRSKGDIAALRLPVEDQEGQRYKVNFHTFIKNLAKIYLKDGSELLQSEFRQIGFFIAEQWYKNKEKPDLASVKTLSQKERKEWLDLFKEDKEELKLDNEEKIEEYFDRVITVYAEKFGKSFEEEDLSKVQNKDLIVGEYKVDPYKFIVNVAKVYVEDNPDEALCDIFFKIGLFVAEEWFWRREKPEPDFMSDQICDLEGSDPKLIFPSSPVKLARPEEKGEKVRIVGKK